MSTVISIENLWKEYRLGVIGYGTLTADLQSWWSRMRGKEDPNSLIALKKGNEKQVEGDRFWALRGVDLQIEQGEILGIIGQNGAGKSTLLKILSRVTAPTRGSIKVHGRIASLLEVGTGFHPELTGRENVYLNGVILGMSRQEIARKFDEILDFSGVEDHIDTPVKRYSSGMRVRLAFAVAAFLEPEILIVDEVLAVGDVEFQKKAIGKMEEVSSEYGRTVLFVSHNLVSIKRLCNSCMLLEDGLIKYSGEVETCISKYLQGQHTDIQTKKKWTFDKAPGEYGIKLLSIELANDEERDCFYIDSCLSVAISLGCTKEAATIDTIIKIVNSQKDVLFSSRNYISSNRDSMQGVYFVKVDLPPKLLNSGEYSIDLVVKENGRYNLLKETEIIKFTIEFGENLKYETRMPGYIYQELNWSVQHKVCDLGG